MSIKFCRPSVYAVKELDHLLSSQEKRTASEPPFFGLPFTHPHSFGNWVRSAVAMIEVFAISIKANWFVINEDDIFLSLQPMTPHAVMVCIVFRLAGHRPALRMTISLISLA